MPLERAKDSLLSLEEFAEQCNSYSPDNSTDTDEPLLSEPQEEYDNQELYQPLLVEEEETKISPDEIASVRLVDPKENPEEYVPYWKPGEELHDYIKVEPLDPNDKAIAHITTRKKRMGCFSLPFCNNIAQTDDNDDDENGCFKEVDVNKLLEEMKWSNDSQHGEGIVKRSSMYIQTFLGINQVIRQSFQPTIYHVEHQSKIKCVRFAPLKHVVRISPTKLLTKEEYEDYWWQLKDFDIFKSSISLLTRPEEEEAACQSLLANGRKSVTEHISNWWHKYGDSRRGLEKVASTVVAKQIMASYKEATRMVLAEQRHQRYTHQPDPEKLARIYHEYTGWSSDLALAAAASDEDAVKTNFDDSKRKSREYFLLKQIYKNGMKVHKHMPQFMLPVGFQPKGYLEEQWDQSTTGSSDSRKKPSENAQNWNWPIWRRAG